MISAVEKIIKERHDSTVFGALGINIQKIDPNETVVSLQIDHRHYQHMGVVHGGIYVLLAESAASIAGACTLSDPSQNVVGLEINANHLRATREGILSAHSLCLHKGEKTLVYEVRIVDNKNRLVSIARCTLMIIRHEPA